MENSYHSKTFSDPEWNTAFVIYSSDNIQLPKVVVVSSKINESLRGKQSKKFADTILEKLSFLGFTRKDLKRKYGFLHQNSQTEVPKFKFCDVSGMAADKIIFDRLKCAANDPTNVKSFVWHSGLNIIGHLLFLSCLSLIKLVFASNAKQ